MLGFRRIYSFHLIFAKLNLAGKAPELLTRDWFPNIDAGESNDSRFNINHIHGAFFGSTLEITPTILDASKRLNIRLPAWKKTVSGGESLIE